MNEKRKARLVEIMLNMQSLANEFNTYGMFWFTTTLLHIAEELDDYIEDETL